MKKFICSIVIVLIIFLMFSVNQIVMVEAEDFDLAVEAAILIDADTGQVLFDKNADEKLPPASITKIMTLLLTMEQVEKGTISLNDELTISKFAESMGGSQIFLAANTRVKLGDLLKAVTIASANDASVAIAETIAGTYENFVDQMNKKAKEMGMNNTHFVNSTGLPPEHGEHYTTARDISIMARELVKYPQVLKWASTWVEYLELPGRKAMLVNTNKLIKKYPGMDGLKTGHTNAAGFSLAATAKRDNLRLISVVLKTDSELGREETTARLLDFGFNTFNKQLIITKGDKVQNIKVPTGKKTITVAEIAKDLNVLVKKNSQDSLLKKVIINEELKAPINKGDVLGKEIVIQDNKVLGEVNLLATEDIEKVGLFTRLWRSFINWVGSLLQKI